LITISKIFSNGEFSAGRGWARRSGCAVRCPVLRQAQSHASGEHSPLRMRTAVDREEWLTRLAREHLWPLIRTRQGAVPQSWRISVKLRRERGKAVPANAARWVEVFSRDQCRHIELSPLLTAYEATHILLHELIHASVGIDRGHDKEFRRLARAVGLTGPIRSTAPDKALDQWMRKVLRRMPRYPAQRLYPAGWGPPSRMLTMLCPVCSYVIRVARLMLTLGIPTCPNATCRDRGKPMIQCVRTSKVIPTNCSPTRSGIRFIRHAPTRS
jgi:hypothetical protein